MCRLSAAVLCALCLLTAPLSAVRADGIAFPDNAPRTTARELMRLCSSHDDVDYGYCAGYISAVGDRMLTEYVGSFRACHHENIRSQQYVDIFTDYMRRFPAVQPQDAQETVAAALARAFPCDPEGKFSN